MPQADIGLIGLAVMGENLVLNMANHGHTVAVFNRTTSKVDDFVNGRGQGLKFVGARSPEEVVAAMDACSRPEELDARYCCAADGDFSEKSVNRIALKEALSSLKPRERQIIMMRYFMDIFVKADSNI